MRRGLCMCVTHHHLIRPVCCCSFFQFHGQISAVSIQGTRATIEFADSRAARSALLFDKAGFMGQPIGVQLAGGDSPETAEPPLSSSPHPGEQPPSAEDSPSPAPGSGSEEEFEKVEKVEVDAAHPEAPDTEHTHGRSAFAGRPLACFQEALQDHPINDARALLGLTTIGLAVLSLC